MLDATIPPVAEVAPGTTISVDTLDCVAGLISRPTDLIAHVGDLIDRLGGVNFVSGPFAIPGPNPETSSR